MKLETALYQEVVWGTIEELGVSEARKVETIAGKEEPVLSEPKRLRPGKQKFTCWDTASTLNKKQSGEIRKWVWWCSWWGHELCQNVKVIVVPCCSIIIIAQQREMKLPQRLDMTKVVLSWVKWTCWWGNVVRINGWPNVENEGEARKTIRISPQGRFARLKIRVVLLPDEIEGIYLMVRHFFTVAV